jgi:hypothetical protein
VFFVLGGRASGEDIAQSTTDESTAEPELVPGEEVVHWSRLPLWGAKEAHEHGFELPLPLGISTTYYMEKQDVRVPEVKLGWGGAELLDIGGLVQVTDVQTEQEVWSTRFDSWVLPFLNLFAVAGYVDGQADLELGPGPIPFLAKRGPKLDIELEYEGPTVGLGGTLAAGFKPIKDRPTIVFGQAGLVFTKTFLDFDQVVKSLDTVDVTILSMRLGVRERILQHPSLGDLHLSLWGGAMYQDIQEVMTGRLGILDLDFRAEVDEVNPWNTMIGGRLEIGKNFDVMVEVGCGDRESLMLGATFRF